MKTANASSSYPVAVITASSPLNQNGIAISDSEAVTSDADYEGGGLPSHPSSSFGSDLEPLLQRCSKGSRSEPKEEEGWEGNPPPS